MLGLLVVCSLQRCNEDRSSTVSLNTSSQLSLSKATMAFHAGIVSHGGFKNGLTTMGLRLRAEEIQQLFDR